uniref:Uncharacterized protein n=1 Tax=Lepeophtheirus salmonis TaxID=72036 RepID=A0A0K2T9L3_LEPSM
MSRFHLCHILISECSVTCPSLLLFL